MGKRQSSSSEGWNAFDDIDELRKKQVAHLERQLHEVEKHFVQCFSTEAGKKVLSYLKDKTLNMPTWNYELEGDTAVHAGFFREGQNSIVREIQFRIDQGMKRGGK